MASRGWEGVLPRKEDGDREESAVDPGAFTDDEPPTVVADVSAFHFADKDSPTVEAADLNEDEVSAPPPPPRGRPNGRPVVVKERGPRPRGDDAAQAGGGTSTRDLSSDLVPSTSNPGRKLRLPLPGEAGKKSSSAPNIPDAEPILVSAPAGAARPQAPVAVLSQDLPGPPRVLSHVELMEKLAGGTAEKEPRKASFYAEYKEVVHAVLIGIALLGGVIAYKVSQPDEPSAEPRRLREVKPANAPTPPTPQVASSPAGGTPAPGVPPQPGPPGPAHGESPGRPPPLPTGPLTPARPAKSAKSATPMISIVSSPSGASVEINGVVYGNTPLIRPSPTNIEKLSIRLRLDDHKKWEKDITSNAAGHFTVNAKLEPTRAPR